MPDPLPDGEQRPSPPSTHSAASRNDAHAVRHVVHNVDSIAASSAEDLIDLLRKLDEGAASSVEDGRMLRELIRREVHCRLGRLAAPWAADPQWRPNPTRRAELEEALRGATPAFEDYVSRFRTTMARQTRAYVRSCRASDSSGATREPGRSAWPRRCAVTGFRPT